MTDTITTAIAELVGPGPHPVARTRAHDAGVVFGRDVRVETPHMSGAAVFVIVLDGAIFAVRRFEIETLHCAAVLAEHGRRVRLEVHPAL